MDGAHEFHDHNMQDLVKEFRTNLIKTIPYVHEDAGKIERSHRTIMGMCRAIMLKTAGLPGMFWNLAIDAAIFITFVSLRR